MLISIIDVIFDMLTSMLIDGRTAKIFDVKFFVRDDKKVIFGVICTYDVTTTRTYDGCRLW